MRPKMSPKRRFLAAMMGGSVDRIPVGNVVSVATQELMKESGACFPSAHLHADEMAQLALAGHEILGYDTVMPVFSVVQESAALGCDMDWGSPSMMPGTRNHPFADKDNVEIPGGWIEQPPVQVVLDALGILRKSVGDHVVVVGKAMGPWSLSYHMMGVENFLVNTVTDPDRVHRFLDELKMVTIEFAKAQMQAGADIICLADHATGGMVSPQMYRDVLLPIHQEIIAEIGCPTVLHCCGNISDRLQYFAHTGIDCCHFESQVSVPKALELADGKITLIGNINNPEVLLAGAEDAVIHAVRDAIDAGIKLLAPECAVPLTTPTRNLRALVSVADGPDTRERA